MLITESQCAFQVRILNAPTSNPGQKHYPVVHGCKFGTSVGHRRHSQANSKLSWWHIGSKFLSASQIPLRTGKVRSRPCLARRLGRRVETQRPSGARGDHVLSFVSRAHPRGTSVCLQARATVSASAPRSSSFPPDRLQIARRLPPTSDNSEPRRRRATTSCLSNSRLPTSPLRRSTPCTTTTLSRHHPPGGARTTPTCEWCPAPAHGRPKSRRRRRLRSRRPTSKILSGRKQLGPGLFGPALGARRGGTDGELRALGRSSWSGALTGDSLLNCSDGGQPVSGEVLCGGCVGSGTASGARRADPSGASRGR